MEDNMRNNVDVEEVEVTDVAEVQVIEKKKGFHPIKGLQAKIEKHPRAAKFAGGVAIAAAATLTTLAVLGRKKRSKSDEFCWDSGEFDDGVDHGAEVSADFTHEDGYVNHVDLT